MRLVREILYILNSCKMFYNRSNLFYKYYKWLRMLANAVANHTNVLQINVNAKHGYLICIILIAGVSLCLISARPCPISLFSFKFGRIFHIFPAFCGNVNMNSGESLQTSYDHLQTSYGNYKCLAINRNGLLLLTNMLRTCFSCKF